MKYMETIFMYWKTEFGIHTAIANMYMLALKDENKIKYPKMYAFADKRWRYHMKKGLNVLKKKIEQMKEAEGL